MATDAPTDVANPMPYAPTWETAVESDEQKAIAAMRTGPNAVCGDCRSTALPTFVAIQAGDPDRASFVCAACAGVHRQAACQRVASVSNDLWTRAQVEFVGRLGNAVTNATFGAGLDAVPPEATRSQRGAFIAAKYGYEGVPAGTGAPDGKVDDDGAVDSGAAAGADADAVSSAGRAGGRLMVVVAGADELENRDSGVGGDVSDPYCTVTLGAVKHKTKVIANNLSPLFNEVLGMFPWNGSDTMLINVFDHDALTRHDDIGHATVNLAGIPPMVEQAITVPLQGVKSGTVTLRLTFFSDAEWL